MAATYPREIIYIFSVQDQKSKALLFVAIDDFSKYFFNLGVSDNFGDNTYEEVIRKLLSAKRFCEGKGRFKLIVGFGESVVKKIRPEIEKLNGTIEYDVDLAINSGWPYAQRALASFDIKPVSLVVSKIESWVNFLSPDFIRSAIPVPGNFSTQAQKLLVNFKEQFVSGIEHNALIDYKANQALANLTLDQRQTFTRKLPSIPPHNGIIYIDVGNGNTSDFVYRYTHQQDSFNLVSIRQYSKEISKIGLSVGSVNSQGEVTLLSPGGMNDILNTAMLMAIVMDSATAKKYGFKVNYNPDAFSLNPESLNIIPIAKSLYVSTEK